MASRTSPESSKCDFKFLLVFGFKFKIHFLHFRSYFGLQNRPQNRPKIDIGGQSPPRRFRTAFLEPFWHHFALILGPPDLHFGAFIIPHLLLVSALGSSVLSARWPVSGAQPPAGSGQRACQAQLGPLKRSEIKMYGLGTARNTQRLTLVKLP